jgi:hypothetical protein
VAGGAAAATAGAGASAGAGAEAGAGVTGAGSGGGPGCASAIEALASTAELTLVDGPHPCGAVDAASVACGVFRARVEKPLSSSGPLDDPALDDALAPVELLLAVRAPLGDMCGRRWILFDAGGHGQGYGRSFGGQAPGKLQPGGAGFGDDLIKSYNDDGYVTVDVIWECPDQGATAPCGSSTPFAGWAPLFPAGSGWFRNTGGAGYIGAASRARVVYEWAFANAGGKKLCAHAHSSGSGRLVATLTRYGGTSLFQSVVFDGGPVWAYAPWYCGVDAGPLGPRTDTFPLEAGSGFRFIYDCARSPGNNETACSYESCTKSSYDATAFLADSSFHAGTHALPATHVGVALGELDTSGAGPHARLWLSGYGFGSLALPGLTAASVTVRQGYCDETEASYVDGGTRSCSEWDAKGFAGVDPNAGRGFDARLLGVGHSTTAAKGGMDVARELMVAHCPTSGS